MWLERLVQKAWHLAHRWESLWRGILLRWLILLCGGDCGPGLRVGKGSLFKYPPHKGYRIGARVHFGRHVTLDVSPGAYLHVGNDVRFTGWNVLAAQAGITIGDDSIFGEGACLRDADHGMEAGSPYRTQALSAAPITVEQNVWVGRLVSILKGSAIRQDAVVAAHAVVRGEAEARTIVGGVPARLLRRLDLSRED